MNGAGFHLAIAAAWVFVVMVGARGHGASMPAAIRSAALAGVIALALSYGADKVSPTNPDCFEQTPTGNGSC